MQIEWATQYRRWIIPTLVVALWSFSAPARAALSVVHLSSDDAASSVISDTAVVVEGRIGDGVEQNVGGSDSRAFELALGSSVATPAGAVNFHWDNGPAAASLLLSYDPAGNTVTLTVGLQTLAYQPAGGFTDLFIRARAARADLSTAVFIENLLLDGVPVGGAATVPWPGPGLDILWLSGADLHRGFSLSGTIVLCWVPPVTLDDPMPRDDELAFQLTLATASGCAIDAQCDDENGCTTDTCVDGQCAHAPLPDCHPCVGDGTCDDQNPCTLDTCGDTGTCQLAPVSGCIRCSTALDCGNTDACTTQECSAAGVCVSSPSAGCTLCTSDAEGSCTDGLDDDCDGEIDCADQDCAADPACGVPPASEICGDCLDNDGDGLVDFEDPDCCAAPADLFIQRLRLRPTPKRHPIMPWIRIVSHSQAIPSVRFTPTTADTTLQLRDAGGELFCRTVEAPFWQHRPRNGARFKDKKGRLKGGIRLGRWRLDPRGETVFRMRGRGFPLRQVDGSAVQVTVRLGNQCLRTLSLMQKRPSGTLAFP